MKLLLALFFIIPVLAHAQLISSNRDLGLTEKEFTELYGSVKEYNIEQSMMYNSFHKRMAAFIGAKYIWVQEALIQYMAENGCGRNVDADIEHTPMEWDLKYECMSCTMNDVIIYAYVDEKSLRIKKMEITGNVDYVIKLFLGYWYKSDLKLDKLKKGAVIYQDHVTDRITFSWKTKYPVITITKCPTLDKLF